MLIAAFFPTSRSSVTILLLFKIIFNCGKIHIRDTPCPRKRSPSKMVDAGAVAAQCSSNCEAMPHVQEQRRSPSKMVGGQNRV